MIFTSSVILKTDDKGIMDLIMKKKIIITLISSFCFQALGSEAMRYAKHGCKVMRNNKSCVAYEKLLKLPGITSRSVASSYDDMDDTSEHVINNGAMKVNLKIKYNKGVMNKVFSDCKEYGTHVKDCKLYTCVYKHPFSGQNLQKEILGFSGGKCKTKEEMPNNGLISCSYSKNNLSMVAEFSDSMGKKHSDKMNEWMNNETCTITGY